MVDTYGADQCQAIEALVLETYRFVWSRRYVDIKLMCLVPWLVIKAMVIEWSHTIEGLFSHTCCDCCCIDKEVCVNFGSTQRVYFFSSLFSDDSIKHQSWVYTAEQMIWDVFRLKTFSQSSSAFKL